jgi:large subunit ribosomal protein L9
MKVLFVEDVMGTAYAGDVKVVKDGFARNYLLPKKLAVLATPDQMNRVKRLQAAASKRREATEGEMKKVAQVLAGATITIEARAGRNDRLYGSITNVMVAEELAKLAGRAVDRRRIIMDPIRHLGSYQVPVKLHPGIEPKVTVVVTSPGVVAGEGEPEATVEEVVEKIKAEEAKPEEQPKAEAAESPAAEEETK